MAFVERGSFHWQLRTRSLALGPRTLVMGILNVTPDSFSDGGLYADPAAAVEHALALLDEGADLLDIGGESTRPGSRPLRSRQEQERILPVLESIVRQRPAAVVSVDTYQAATARAAVAAGAEIVNDVSAFQWDSAMAEACAELGCGVILMHTRGRPSEWPALRRLRQDEVVPLVRAGLSEALGRASAANIPRSRIVLDPGYGFGKIYDENYPLLAHLDQLLPLGQPLLAGVSRKSFLNRATSGHGKAGASRSARDHATLAATTAAILAGASLVRVHDVRSAVEAARIADAILQAV